MIILSNIWPELTLTITSVLCLLILFRFKRQQSTISFVISVIFFVLFLIALIITVMGLGIDFPILALIMFGVPALVFAFIAIWYKNSENHLIYQKLRTIVLTIFYSAIIIISVGSIIRQAYYRLQTSGVTGVTNDQAVSKAKEKMVELSQGENNPILKDADCSVNVGPGEKETGSTYDVWCDYPDKNAQGGWGYRYFSVNSKDGTITERNH